MAPMGQMTTRTLLYILSFCTLALGLIGLSEAIHPSRTALGVSSPATRAFGPVIVAVGAGLFVAARRTNRKAVPKPAFLVWVGLGAMLVPVVIWAAGTFLAPVDSAVWLPMVAVAGILIALPGFGMFFGGLRRVREPASQTGSSAPVTKVKRRR